MHYPFYINAFQTSSVSSLRTFTMTKVSAWTSPEQPLEYSKKADDIVMLFSIMDSEEKGDNDLTNENLSISNNLKNEKHCGFLSPLKNNPSWSKEAAHLYREVCECGKRRFWTKKSADQDDFQSLLTSSPRTSPDPPLNEDRLDKLCTIFLVLVTIIIILFLFFFRNSDLLLQTND